MFTKIIIKIAISISLFLTSCFTLSLTDQGNRSHIIRLSNLENYIKEMDSTDGWKTEFESLPPPQTQLKAWSYAEKKENLGKHRYPPPEDNLLTYDDTRVNLTKNPGDQFSDFINANWIDGVREVKRYIGTQCPIPSTIIDFYRMNKCVRYFPDAMVTYGDIQVTLQRKTEFPDVIVRVYSLKRGPSIRVFVHNHFVSWPDMGVPNDPKQLLNLIQQYRSSDTYTRAWPLLVHCSAGVGRTGTFLLTDAIFEQAMATDTLDFLNHLSNIRNQRISLVEKPEQYALAHRVILQAYKEGLFDPTKKSPYNPQAISSGGSTNPAFMNLQVVAYFIAAVVTLQKTTA